MTTQPPEEQSIAARLEELKIAMLELTGKIDFYRLDLEGARSQIGRLESEARMLAQEIKLCEAKRALIQSHKELLIVVTNRPDKPAS